MEGLQGRRFVSSDGREISDRKRVERLGRGMNEGELMMHEGGKIFVSVHSHFFGPTETPDPVIAEEFRYRSPDLLTSSTSLARHPYQITHMTRLQRRDPLTRRRISSHLTFPSPPTSGVSSGIKAPNDGDRVLTLTIFACFVRFELCLGCVERFD